jgi:hypothetical protein
MSAWEREHGELPSPIWSLLDRKVGQGLFVFAWAEWLQLQHLIFQQLELLRQISIDPAKEVAQTCSLLCSRREHLSFLKQGRGSAGTRSPGTANAKGRGTRETS